MIPLPTPGTFLKPVGLTGYAYCERIDSVRLVEGYDELDLIPNWSTTRFGLTEDGQPFADGHQSKGGVTNVRLVAPGVYRRSSEVGGYRHPEYYRVMTPRGQLDLFA